MESYADHQADLTRLVPNPAKALAAGKVAAARADLINPQTAITGALQAATRKAGEPGEGGRALIEPTVGLALRAAQADPQDAQEASRTTRPTWHWGSAAQELDARDRRQTPHPRHLDERLEQ